MCSVAGGWVFIPQPCVYVGSFKPGSKGAVRSESNNGGGKVWVNKEANIFVARRCSKCNVLRIHLSDLDAGLE